MIITGIIIFLWIIYKYSIGWIPHGETMTIIGFFALMVNIVSTIILAKYQDNSLDIRAVWLCTRNDAINNILIIIAGFLTIMFSSISRYSGQYMDGCYCSMERCDHHPRVRT